jgi:hypothetical protein
MYTAKVRISATQGHGLILERWYAAPFRTHTLADRLPNSFGVLFSLGYNHVMVKSSGMESRILLLAEFKKRQSMGWFLAAFRSSQ